MLAKLTVKGGIITGFAILIICKLIDEKAGDLLESLHKNMSKPFSLSFLKFDANMNVWLSVSQCIGLTFIYLLLVCGAVYLFK